MKILLLALLPAFALGQVPPKKIQIVLLGTFHFGATGDAKKTSFPDLFTDRRQHELDALLGKLAAFGPETIFVENEPSRQARWDSVYAAYRQGTEPTGTRRQNEIFQIGVKLARRLNLPRVTCIDYQTPDYEDSSYVPRSASEKLHIEYMRKLWSLPEEKIGKSNEKFFYLKNPNRWPNADSLLAASTLTEHYRYLNSPRKLQSNDYSEFNYWLLAEGQGEDYTGADKLANFWMLRNVKIYQNILRNSSLQDRRYLLLIGSSHVQMLKDWFKNHPYFEVVDVADVLR
jgi:hypothetical protein